MATPDGRHRIVFNGEVYNYRDLRRSLEARGERFTTGSDTEVLLRLLALRRPGGARAGPRHVRARVVGRRRRARWCSRAIDSASSRCTWRRPDRSIAFASEIHALVAAGLVDRAHRSGRRAGLPGVGHGAAVADLCRRRREPGAGNVDALVPGRRLRASAPFADVAGDLRAAALGLHASRSCAQRVGAAVQQSVAAHLVADVPVGVFLSGGIDSSAILSAASDAGVAGLNTYTVRFDDRVVRARVRAARRVDVRRDASRAACSMPSRIVSDLPRILARLDQPTLDAVNSYYVSAAVAETGIKAVLSGAGGDEMFGGYPSFRRLPRGDALEAADGSRSCRR